MGKPWRDKDTLKRHCDRGLSQAEVAEELGCAQKTISYWMKKFDIPSNNSRGRGDLSASDTPATFGTYEHNGGYEMWHDSVDNLRVRVHRLVAVAEYGFEAVKGKEVHHKKNIPWLNTPDNLEPMTASEHRSIHSTGWDSENLPEGFGGFTETREWVLERQDDNPSSEKQPVEVCFYCQDSVSDPVESPEGERCHSDCLEKEEERLAELAGGDWL